MSSAGRCPLCGNLCTQGHACSTMPPVPLHIADLKRNVRIVVMPLRKGDKYENALPPHVRKANR